MPSVDGTTGTGLEPMGHAGHGVGRFLRSGRVEREAFRQRKVVAVAALGDQRLAAASSQAFTLAALA